MPTQWETFPIKFEGGWITNLGRLEQGINVPGSATILQNFEPSIEGGYKKLLGYQKFSPNAVPGSGQIVGVAVAGQDKCIARRGTKYYLGSGGAWVEKATASTAGAARVRHASYNFNGTPKIVMVDGLNKPALYDSVAETITFDASAPTDATGASIVEVFKNQLFFAKGSTLCHTVPYTDNDYDIADGASVINTGDVITGLVVFREQLIIFGANRIQRLVGNTSTDFVLQPIADNTGCLSPDTVQEVGGDIMYLGPDGVRWLSATERNNDFGLERASENIQTQMLRTINSNGFLTSLVVRAKNQYRLFNFQSNVGRQFSEGFLATKFSDQSVENIQWASTKGIKVYAVDSKQFADAEKIIFSSDGDYVYVMENGSSFDGEPIEAVFETPYISFTDPKIRKTFYKHTLYTNVTGTFNLTVSLRLDYGRPNVIQPQSFDIGSVGAQVFYYGDPNSRYGAAIYSTTLQDLYVNNLVGSGFTAAVRYTDISTRPTFLLEYAVLEFSQDERR